MGCFLFSLVEAVPRLKPPYDSGILRGSLKRERSTTKCTAMPSGVGARYATQAASRSRKNSVFNWMGFGAAFPYGSAMSP